MQNKYGTAVFFWDKYWSEESSLWKGEAERHLSSEDLGQLSESLRYTFSWNLHLFWIFKRGGMAILLPKKRVLCSDIYLQKHHLEPPRQNGILLAIYKLVTYIYSQFSQLGN